MIFEVLLEAFAFLLSLVGIGLIYVAVQNSRKSEFVPVYYFIAFSLGSVALLSMARILSLVYKSSILVSDVVQSLLLAYVALFIFGALWQSYEAAMCTPPYVDVDE